jgi:cytochrome c oxidase cbb3-type subunit 1
MQASHPPAAVYADTAVRQFSLMAVVWGVVGMLVGVFIAAQLAWPELNLGIPGSATAACARCTPTP